MLCRDQVLEGKDQCLIPSLPRAQHSTTSHVTHTQYEVSNKQIPLVKFRLLLKVLNAFESSLNKHKSHPNCFCFLQTLWCSKLSSVPHCSSPGFTFTPSLLTAPNLLNVTWVNTRELNIFIFRKNMSRNYLLKYNLNPKIISFKTSTTILNFSQRSLF